MFILLSRWTTWSWLRKQRCYPFLTLSQFQQNIQCNMHVNKQFAFENFETLREKTVEKQYANRNFKSALYTLNSNDIQINNNTNAIQSTLNEEIIYISMCERERVSLHRMVFSTKCFFLFSLHFFFHLFIFLCFFVVVVSSIGSNHMLIHTVAYISFGYLKGCTQPIKRSIFGVCEYVMPYRFR